MFQAPLPFCLTNPPQWAAEFPHSRATERRERRKQTATHAAGHLSKVSTKKHDRSEEMYKYAHQLHYHSILLNSYFSSSHRSPGSPPGGPHVIPHQHHLPQRTEALTTHQWSDTRHWVFTHKSPFGTEWGRRRLKLLFWYGHIRITDLHLITTWELLHFEPNQLQSKTLHLSRLRSEINIFCLVKLIFQSLLNPCKIIVLTKSQNFCCCWIRMQVVSVTQRWVQQLMSLSN